MKIRPVTSSITRRRSIDATTPTYTAKRDYKLLLSSAETINKVDEKLYRLTETSPVEAIEIISTEVSRQLNLIKKSNNSNHISRLSMNSQLRHLSMELGEVSKASRTGKLTLFNIDKKIENLKSQIIETQKLQLEELDNQEIYFHIQERMLASKIFLDIKKNFLNEQLKQKSLILQEVQKMRSTTAEHLSRNTRQLKDLNKTFSNFNNRKDSISNKLQVDKDDLDFIDLGRENRFLRQQEIIERVGISEKDRNEKNIRESLLLHKLWHKKLTYLLKRFTEKFSKVDMAFRKIKSVTGLETITEIVEKFLTKEENLSELTRIIKKNKEYLDEYAKRNSEIQEKIKLIEVTDKHSITSETIKALTQKISLLSTRNFTIHSKHMEIISIVKTISEWIVKMIKQFDPSFNLQSYKLAHLVKILREKIHENIRPADKFPTQESTFFITANQITAAKSSKFSLYEHVELHELNHIDTESSKSSWYSYEKKNKKKVNVSKN